MHFHAQVIGTLDQLTMALLTQHDKALIDRFDGFRQYLSSSSQIMNFPEDAVDLRNSSIAWLKI